MLMLMLFLGAEVALLVLCLPKVTSLLVVGHVRARSFTPNARG
jgi:hypothetical protein